ncbi:hypothetical protein [Gloeocapsa sp. PCC 73106]|uniref:hypothetical protein n=1 Tax=Gloeocapsa sp. PCC 73106 TaxID=102232 RepID=UPI0002ACBD40|nr:hypothetical protein [Gloeocapsa sp. PCC 73106]ELR97267.1 hypothetical protein GLO73106DRAFT_00010730 [Gloeocapsa sp. PCC 73106]
MDAFSPTPPAWTMTATHALKFCCPRCQAPASLATEVWLNRRSPVIKADGRRQWQEFYHCACGQVWWGWSSDRPPSNLVRD